MEILSLFEHIALNEKKSNKSKPKSEEMFNRWKKLVNMSPSELSSFMKTQNGKVAGLSKKQASSQGIYNGRQSAKWILKMLSKNPKSWEDAKAKFTPEEWAWVGRQVSFISRMRGAKPKKTDPFLQKRSNGEVKKWENGEPKMTRWLTSLLIWGHDPRK